MNTYSISYDLDKPNRNYDGVIDKIKELANGYCPVTQSHWLINSSLSATQIRDEIGTEMDSGDKLMVNEVGNLWATKGMSNEVNDWLKNTWRSSCKVA